MADGWETATRDVVWVRLSGVLEGRGDGELVGWCSGCWVEVDSGDVVVWHGWVVVVEASGGWVNVVEICGPGGARELLHVVVEAGGGVHDVRSVAVVVKHVLAVGLVAV